MGQARARYINATIGTATLLITVGETFVGRLDPNKAKTSGATATAMLNRPPNLATMPGRVLVGRLQGAKMQIDNAEDLARACENIAKAYEKSDPQATIWPVHVFFLRNDGRWTEFLTQFDLDRIAAEEPRPVHMAGILTGDIERVRRFWAPPATIDPVVYQG